MGMRWALSLVLVVLTVAACSSSGAHGADAGPTAADDGSTPDGYGYDVAPDHVSATCPVSFSPGACGCGAPCCGLKPDSGPPPLPPYTCQPLPSQCATSPTCDCIACYSDCGACTPLGNGQYSDGGGGGASCNYDASSGTFTVTCLNV